MSRGNWGAHQYWTWPGVGTSLRFRLWGLGTRHPAPSRASQRSFARHVMCTSSQAEEANVENLLVFLVHEISFSFTNVGWLSLRFCHKSSGIPLSFPWKSCDSAVYSPAFKGQIKFVARLLSRFPLSGAFRKKTLFYRRRASVRIMCTSMSIFVVLFTNCTPNPTHHPSPIPTPLPPPPSPTPSHPKEKNQQ